MSEAMKPTPGPWTLGDENNACCEVTLGTEHNLTCNLDRRDNNSWAEVISRDEMLANARLIAEAGTVFHETGLSPRQLLEQRDELLAAAKSVLAWFEAEDDHTKADFYQRIQMCRDSEDAIRAAIAKCEGKP